MQPMKYRPEVDGLRALAVLPVIFFHARFAGFEGGYIGVDIFFVISGYLITSIIRDDLSQGRFSIIRFYERRARRILPALYFMILACLPLAWFWMMPSQLKTFCQSLVAVATFSANVFFFQKSGYFEPAVELNPMLHTWSLAVEEQYYVVFPLLMWVLSRFRRSVTPACFAVFALASLLVAERMSRTDPTANYFLATGRVWELLTGAMIALDVDRRWANGRPAAAGAALGLCALVASLFVLDARTPFPSTWALLPVLGTALVVYFASPENWVGRLLSTRALVGVGLVSYSTYLWHQPLFAFARIHSLLEPSAWVFAGLSALSLGLGFLSWKYVEAPFRQKSKFSRRQVFSYSAAAVAAAVSLGAVGHVTGGFSEAKFRMAGPQTRALLTRLEEVSALRTQTWEKVSEGASRPFDADPGKRRVLILGDSLAEDVYVATQLASPPFDRLQVRQFVLDDLCMDQLNQAADGRDGCSREVRELRSSKLLEEADLVVVTAGWNMQAPDLVDRLLTDLGPRDVVVVGTAAFAVMPSLLYHIGTQETPQSRWPEFFGSNMHDSSRIASQKLAQVAAKHGARFFDKYTTFCPTLGPHPRCNLIDDSGNPLLIDQSHVTVGGALLLARRIAEDGVLEEAGGASRTHR